MKRLERTHINVLIEAPPPPPIIVRCGLPPLLLLSCNKLAFRLSALMDSDLAWVNGKSARQS